MRNDFVSEVQYRTFDGGKSWMLLRILILTCLIMAHADGLKESISVSQRSSMNQGDLEALGPVRLLRKEKKLNQMPPFVNPPLSIDQIWKQFTTWLKNLRFILDVNRDGKIDFQDTKEAANAFFDSLPTPAALRKKFEKAAAIFGQEALIKSEIACAAGAVLEAAVLSQKMPGVYIRECLGQKSLTRARSHLISAEKTMNSTRAVLRRYIKNKDSRCLSTTTRADASLFNSERIEVAMHLSNTIAAVNDALQQLFTSVKKYETKTRCWALVSIGFLMYRKFDLLGAVSVCTTALATLMSLRLELVRRQQLAEAESVKRRHDALVAALPLLVSEFTDAQQ